MSISIERLSDLIPELVSTNRGMNNQSREGRQFTEKELGDMISRLLTKTQSVNSQRVRQTAVAAGDTRLLEQTEALETLVGNGVLERMEEFLSGNLRAGQTDDLIDQFNELNDIITSVTEQSPIAISNMIRGQISTLRSDKTSSTRRASAISNFQNVTGQSLTEGDLQSIIAGIEDQTINVNEIADLMEQVANDNDRRVMADDELESAIRDLVNGVDAGLIETDQLGATIRDLLPAIEDSSINAELMTRLTEDPSIEVLNQILEQLSENDIGNIDREKRKQINMVNDSGRFGEAIGNLTPDIVKNAASEGGSILVQLLKGGALIAILGASGLLDQIGGILKDVGLLAFNYIKETVAPKMAELLSDVVPDLGKKFLDSIGSGLDSIIGGDGLGGMIDFFIRKFKTNVEVIGEMLMLSARKAAAFLNPFDGDLEVRSATLDALTEAKQQVQKVVFTDENGNIKIADESGLILREGLSQTSAISEIMGGAIDRRIPRAAGEFGGVMGELTAREISTTQTDYLNQINSDNPFVVEQRQSFKEIQETKAEVQKLVRQNLGTMSLKDGGMRRSSSSAPVATGNSRPRGVAAPLSSFGADTSILNANPGITSE